MAVLGFPGTVDSITVQLSGFQSRHIDVPDVVGSGRDGNRHVFTLSLGEVKQTQLDSSGVFRVEGEVDAVPVPGGPQREGASRSNVHL